MSDRWIYQDGRAWKAFLAMAVGLLLSFSVLGGQQGVSAKDDKAMDIFERLSSEDSRTRNLAVDEILNEHKVLVDKLIALVDPANSGTNSYDTQAAAAYLVGELRAAEAVPVLSRALAEIPTVSIRFSMNRYIEPWQTALVRIGRPSVPAMIENIEKTDDQQLQRRSVTVLVRVLGGRRHMFELLEKLESRSTDEKTTKRIEAAITRQREYYKTGKDAKEPLY